MLQYQVSFPDAIKRAFSNYCCFKGRASRSEFWFWVLFTFIVGTILSFFGNAGEYLSGAASLAFLLPSLGLYWRRLHDTGRAGGWFFICFVPLVGIILLIVWCAQASQPEPNRFGDVPNLVAE